MGKTRPFLLFSLGAFLTALFVAVSVGLVVGPLADRVDDLGESLLYRMRGAAPADPRLVLAAIDDESLGKIGAFPWKRDAYVPLIDGLSEAGARTIVFDVFFLDPSDHPKADAALAAATARSGRVIHAMTSVPESPRQKRPLPAIDKAAAGIGSAWAPIVEPDGTIRMFPADYGFADEPEVHHEATVAVAHYLRRDPGEVVRGLGTHIRLNYRAPWAKRPFRVIPASRVIEGDLSDEDRRALRGAMVFIGSSSRGAFDLFPSPCGGLMPGVLVSMTMADNLLNDRWLRVTWTAPIVVMLCLSLLWMGLACLPFGAYAAGGVLTAGACVVVSYLLFSGGVLLRPMDTLVGFLAALAWSVWARKRLSPEG